jgi:hypothetical protein
MVVPPGYHNDSFPVFAQSGERVTITPAGATNTSGGGSNTDAALLAAILNLPANISRAVRDGIPDRTDYYVAKIGVSPGAAAQNLKTLKQPGAGIIGHIQYCSQLDHNFSVLPALKL